MMTEEELADMVEVKTNWSASASADWSFQAILDLLLWMLCNHQDADRDGSGSMDFQEFVEMMIKVDFFFIFSIWNFFQRESEKETVLELKQAFRVFDKVGA